MVVYFYMDEITPTAENNNFDHELRTTVFDYLVDRYLGKTMTLEEVVTTYHEIEGDCQQLDATEYYYE